MRDDPPTTGQSFETPHSESARPPEKNQNRAPHPPQRPANRSNGGNFFIELAKIAIVAMIVVLPLRMFVAQPFIVSGASMQPTFDSGDYLIVEELSYRFDQPKRQDVVVFRYPNDPSKFFIKRVIGLPGETVIIRDSEVVIKNEENPDGFVLDEPYVSPENEKLEESQEITLGTNEYFVLGDNRAQSSDSRTWGGLSSEFMIGQAFVQLLPITKADVFPGSQNKNINNSDTGEG